MEEKKDLIKITKDYYNSDEADKFYFNFWGGENIHVGIYDKPKTSIKKASKKTIEAMLAIVPKPNKNARILDLGSGYGGAARYLAKKFGCKVDCINLSEKENERNIAMNKEAELDELITVTTGNFEKLPYPRETFDIVWSQDAIVHSNKKEKVFREVAKALKPEARFIFTDPMQSNDCPEGVLQGVLDRIHLEELGSVKKYLRLAIKVDLEKVFVKEMPEQLVTHYSKVLEEVESNYKDIVAKSSKAYIDKMIEGLNHWIEAGKKGYLNWGILQFQKRNK